jgi:Tol biopolymer transport system component
MGRIAMVLALGAMLAFPAVALGTFPGRDGRLAAVYSVSRVEPCGSHECEATRQRIVTMSARGRGKRVIYRCDSCGLSRLAWSPTGRRIAWSNGQRLFVALAAGGPQGAVRGIQGREPAWRPDNGGLVFSMGGKIATVDSTGVPTNVADGHGASWCPDGRIVFVAYDSWVMTVRPDGTGLRRVPRSVSAGRPDCSPDSRHVLFRTGNHLYVAPLYAGATVRRVAAPPQADSPVWSPSGRRIAWSDGHDIWIARRDGRHRRKVTRNRHRGAWLAPSWQPLP